MCSSEKDETPEEQRRREQAERILRAAMPDLEATFRAIRLQITPPADIGRIYDSKYQQMLKSLTTQSSVFSAFDSAAIRGLKVPIPSLQLDYKLLFPNFAALQKNVITQALPSIQLIQGLQRNQFADIIANVRRAIDSSLPPNWRGDEVHIPSDLESMLLDEGLALAWVPPEAVVVKLFDAGSPGMRRRIIGSHWRGITKACEAQLESIADPALTEHVRFATKAARALHGGNHEAAQALSANLLDTILRQNFDKSDRRTVTDRKKRLDIDDYPLRVAIVLGGIWGAFGEFWTHKGDKIPREFSRHGSAHGVSRRQYSRVNSVVALMHVVSLLKLLENDLVHGPV